MLHMVVDKEISPFYVKRFEYPEKRYIKCNKLLLLYIIYLAVLAKAQARITFFFLKHAPQSSCNLL